MGREEGFCKGIVQSSIFLPLLSRKAINHTSNKFSNFATLTNTSHCDNVLLEHNLALELRNRGLLDFIYPVFIGDLKAGEDGDVYGNYFADGCHPSPNNAVVSAVVDRVIMHLKRQSLGSPLLGEMSVRQILDAITGNQGFFLEGRKSEALKGLAKKVVELSHKHGSDNRHS